MSNASSLIRTLIIYSICVPLAIFLGYLIANDMDRSTIFTLALLGVVLAIPLFLKWHHLWLIASFNLNAVVFFVPGRPFLWMGLACISLLISVIQYIINPRLKFLHAPAVTRPLLVLVGVVLITAKLTGGIGLNSLGSEVMGGRKYFYLFCGVIAYFALISQRITPRRAYLCIALFFLASLSALIGELPAFAPKGFYFLLWIFPISATGLQAAVDTGREVYRLENFAGAGAAVLSWMLCRYGLQELFNMRRPIRLLVCAGCVALTLFGGFRSALISFGITFAIVFYLEGMMRSRMLPLLLLGMVICGALVVGFSERLPHSIQRTICFLPVKVDPMVRQDAQDSTEWRLKMWRDVLPEVPPHLLLGKGYALNAKDLASITAVNGGDSGLAGTEYAGDYHSGPLSVIIPFGIFGVMAFVWFLKAGGSVLYKNYKFGHPAYRTLNRFLFAYYITKIFAFVFLFGALNSDLVTFSSLVGLSISLNGGVAKPVRVPVPQLTLGPLRLRGSLSGPVPVPVHSSRPV